MHPAVRRSPTAPAPPAPAAPFIVLAVAIGLCACEPELIAPPEFVDYGRNIYALTSANTLVVFGSRRPDSVARTIAIAGLPEGESLVGIDFGPRDNVLYAVGLSGRVFVIDTTLGDASPVGDGSATTPLVGTAFGVDLNPVPNRLRIHSDAGTNLRINQLTGALAGLDTVLQFLSDDPNRTRTPRVVGTAYTVTSGDTTATTLYAIDSELDILVQLPFPNGGGIRTVGPLQTATGDDVGFDITTATPGSIGVAFATLTRGPGEPSALYTISLTDGRATLIGTLGTALPIRGIAVAP